MPDWGRSKVRDLTTSRGHGQQNAKVIAEGMLLAEAWDAVDEANPGNKKCAKDMDEQDPSTVCYPECVKMHQENGFAPNQISIHLPGTDVHNFVLSYIENAGGWPAEAFNNVDRWLTKHSKKWGAVGVCPDLGGDLSFTLNGIWNNKLQKAPGSSATAIAI